MRKTSDIIKLVLFLLFSAAVLSACGGGASTDSNQNANVNAAAGTLITSSTSAEVVAYEKYVWQKLSMQSRCGRCHAAGGQDPQFVHSESIETAYAEALSFVRGSQVANLASPNDSLMVSVIRNGHKQVNGKSQACWLATDKDCADAIRDFVIAWDAETNGTAAVEKGVELVAPDPVRDVSDSKNYPASSSDFGSLVHTPVLTAHCAGCHTSTASSPQSPYFASNDVNASYIAAQQKMDLSSPENSRFVLRLKDQFHNCWTTDCAADALVMENAITAYANTITPTQVDPKLIVSKAMKLLPPEAIIATGGERHVVNQIALWEFKTGTGAQAYDTSGVEPQINLSLSGNYKWVGGYGVNFTNGRAQASYQASQKLFNNLRTRGEYAIEAWVIPANVVQEDKNIISYSGGSNERNFTIAQNEYNYQFYNRASTTADDTLRSNGGPVLETEAGDEDLQASQQHIVMNFDPVNGRRMYVNGVFTGDVDSSDVGGLLTDWNNTHALILANELGQSVGWQGTLRMVAVHNRILTSAQIQKNFDAGVGQKFFLLFSIGHIDGVPADSYIKVQVEQFDSYSYLFENPVYINLAATTPAIDIPIAGLRIGINGKEAIVGQSFINLTTNRITANNQSISRLGSVIQLQKGSQGDDFFLTFETLGTKNNPFIIADPVDPPAPADLADQSDIGMRTFSEINGTMSDLTTIPTDNAAVFATYSRLRQQLPSTEDINAFGPANIIGISQLAFEYCDQLVDDVILRDDFFNDASEPYLFNGFGQAVATAFDTSTKKEAVVNALYDRMIGIPSVAEGTELINAPTRIEITNELIDELAAGDYPGNLFDRLDGAGRSTNEIIKAMCTSVLGSAAMMVQ